MANLHKSLVFAAHDHFVRNVARGLQSTRASAWKEFVAPFHHGRLIHSPAGLFATSRTICDATRKGRDSYIKKTLLFVSPGWLGFALGVSIN